MREKLKRLNFYSRRLHVRIEGFQLERLVDKAARKGILIRDIRIISDTEAEIRISWQDLKTLKKMAGAIYHITILEESGPGFKLRKLKQRKTAVAGILLAAAIVIMQSFFVASVQISGYRAIPETELRQCLAESGIEEGSYRPDINWDKAEEKLYDQFPQLVWLKLAYDGRDVVLRIAETDTLPEKDAEPENPDQQERSADKPKYVNIVAEKSGYIETVDARWGMAVCETGDFVKKGQILITGAVPISPTTFEENPPDTYYVRAAGQVWAKVPYRLRFAQERYISSTEADNRKFNDQDDQKENQTEDGTCKSIASKTEKSEKEAESKVNQQIRLWAKENLPENAEIINKNLNFIRKGNIIEVGVTLEVHQQIGKEQEIVFGQKNSDKQ